MVCLWVTLFLETYMRSDRNVPSTGEGSIKMVVNKRPLFINSNVKRSVVIYIVLRRFGDVQGPVESMLTFTGVKGRVGLKRVGWVGVCLVEVF